MTCTKWLAAVCLLLIYSGVLAQPKPIDDKAFFKEDRPVKMTLTTDIRQFIAEKKDLNYIDAAVSFTFPDSSLYQGPVRIKPRGNFRKENCRFASIAVDFKYEKSSPFSKLGTLKMVGGCGSAASHEQYLLKEYLVYKIYNLLTDMSFRVRLLNVDYVDTKGKVKPYTQYAFLIEDVDDLAKRNQCIEKELVRFSPLGMQRDQTTLLYLFQYMIGNTDWSIPYYHNIKLLVQKKDTMTMPFPVAYDFDITGLVNPPYGGPPPDLGIERLTQRLYRGYERTLAEIETTAKIFIDKEEAIYALINQFEPLTAASKKEMIEFLNGFYKTIKNKKELKSLFVDGALTN